MADGISGTVILSPVSACCAAAEEPLLADDSSGFSGGIKQLPYEDNHGLLDSQDQQ